MGPSRLLGPSGSVQNRRRAFLGHECNVHDLEIKGSNPGRVEFRVCGTSVLVVLEPDISSF